MPNIDIRSLSVCIQALQKAIKYNDFLSQSDTVDPNDFEESSSIFEIELFNIAKIYKQEEIAGRVNIPLAELLHPPFDEIEANKSL